jgi:hypothetical protein
MMSSGTGALPPAADADVLAGGTGGTSCPRGLRDGRTGTATAGAGASAEARGSAGEIGPGDRVGATAIIVGASAAADGVVVTGGGALA